jgi:hypothetical protein
VLLYKHLPLLFGSSGHVGFPMLKTSLFINTKYYAMCGSNDGHEVTIKGAKGPQSLRTGPTADSPKRALVTISASE